MTKDQINKLLKDGEISPVSSMKYIPGMTEFDYFDSDKKERFYISEKVYTVLLQIFEFFLETEIDEEREMLMNEIKIEEKHYQPGIELKKELFKKLILKQIKLFDACFDTGTVYFDKNAKTKKELFIFDLLTDKNNPSKLIEILKFDKFKGRKIDPALSETILLEWKIDRIQPFYYSQTMEGTFKIIALDQNIKYLQNSLSKFETSTNKEYPLTKQGIAIACILKGKLLYDSTNIDSALLNYFPGTIPTKSQRQALKEQYDMLHDSRTNRIKITINCDKLKTIKHRMDAIYGIKAYLNDKELKEAEILLTQLQKLSDKLKPN